MSRARDLADGALYKIAPSTSGNVLASDGSGNWVSDGALNTLTTTVGTKAPLASPALTGSPTVNGAAIATGTSDSTLGTLTQVFTAGQQTTINLSANALSPSVAVTKEVPQVGITNNQWNVDSAGNGNYTRYNIAPATTISFSGTTATLGSGSFSASDVGKTIEVNNGKLVLTNANGTFSVASTPDNYNTAASGSWQMYGVQFNSTSTRLEIGHTFTSSYAQSVFTYTDNSSIGNSIAQAQGLCFGSNGTKLYIMCSSTQKIYEFNLSAAFDVTTKSLVNSFTTTDFAGTGTDLAIKPDGTRIFCSVSGRVDTYELTTPFDITTCTSHSVVRNMASVDGESTPTGICFSPDGTNMYVVGAGLNRCYHLSLSTGYDPSSTIAMVSETSIGSIDPTAITMNPDGKRWFIYSDSSNAVKVYDTTTAFAFSTVGYTGQYTATNSTNGRGLAFNGTGSQLNIIDVTYDFIYRYDTGALTAPSGYHAAHTTNSIDSTTWTDINSMTATESAGNGTVNYAVSTDDRTTWKIAHNTNGARNIVKNNSGTWQYNSNGTYASETWVNGTTNNELATLQQAMEGAQLATNAYNTNNAGAGYGNNFNVGINPKGVELTPDGNTIFISSDPQNNIKSYSLSAPFSLATTPTNTGSYSYASDFTSEHGFCFADSGSKLYILGVNAGTFLWQYSLSTAYDLSTVSYVRKLDIDSVTGQPRGVFFKTDGSKMFIIDIDTDKIYEWALSTNFDISTASNTANFSVATESTEPVGLTMSSDGTRFHYVGANDNKVRGYTMSTAWDVTSASLTMSTNLSSYVSSGSVTGITFNPLGTIMFICDYTLSSGRITDFTLGSESFTNQMPKTQLDAVSDANQFAVSNDLDLAIILNLSSGTGVPSSDGVSINYDANVANQGAILGTDYNYDVPALNKVRITAVNAATLKVRVV